MPESEIFLLPFRPAIDPNGLTISGAQIFFYRTQTSTPQAVYTSSALTTPLSNPVEANSAGDWPAIYLDQSKIYRVVLKDADGATLNEADPYMPGIVDDLTAEFQAHAFASAALALATPYADTAAGLAATASGGYFSVTSGGFLSVYRDDAGVATLLYTYPTSAALASTDIDKGASLVGFKYPGAGPVDRTLLDKQLENLSLLDFGAVPDDAGVDNGPMIQAAFDYCRDNNISALLAPPGDYRCTTGAVWSSEKSFALIGTGAVAGRATAVDRQAAFQWAGADGAEFLVFETDGTTVANACNGIEIENILIYRGTMESNATDGKGLILRGVYGGAIKNVTISGFSTSLLTDDNPSNAGANSVRCGKINFTDVKCLQASKYRMRLRGTAQCVGHHLCMLEEALVAYEADLAIEAGTNAGRSDGNQFFGGAFIGNDDPLKRPENNIRIIDAIFTSFYGSAFERSSVAGVSVVQNTHTYTPNAVSATFVGCWWDAHSGFAADFNRARVEVIAPRCAAHDGAGAAFRFVGEPDAVGTQPKIGGGIRGGVIEFSGNAGVQIDYADGVTIDGLQGLDADASGEPLVRVESNCVNIRLINLLPGVSTTKYVNGAADTFIVSGQEIKNVDLIEYDSTYYQLIQSGNPVINCDANDYITYDRTSNEFQFFIGGILVGKIDSTGFV